MQVGYEFEQVLEFDPARAEEILAGLPAAAGVFALFGHGELDQPYLTRTADLRRRLRRLLMADAGKENEPTTNAIPSKRLNLGGRVARIAYSRTGSEFEATWLLYRASTELLGADAAERRLRIHAPFLVRMAVENAYPRVYVTNRIAVKALKNYYGPFPSRAAAERYLDESLNLFKLRRCHDELHPDPAFPGCVYSEMKMCLAPCFKGCSDERYAEEAAAVGEYLATRGGSLVIGIAAARDAASEALDFEKAAQLHSAMAKAEAAAHLAEEIVRPIAVLDAVVVQAGVEKQSAALFLVRGGLLVGPVVVGAVEDGLQERIAAGLEALEGMQSGGGRVSSRVLGSHLGLLRRWYYRSEKQRKGEIFFRNEGGDFPMRRIVNGVGRVGNASQVADIQLPQCDV